MTRQLINGIQIDVDVTGSGPALLFIHGLGSCREDWEHQVAEFSKRFTVVTFDLRGHGNSDKPAAPYSLPMFAADAAGVLKALNIGAAHVVGISLGGMIAFQLVVDHPEMVKSLTIVNSGPAVILKTLKAKFAIWVRLYIMRKKGPAKLGEILARNLFPPDRKAAGEVFAQRYARNDPQAYKATVEAFVGWSVADRIKDIRCPVLAIAAENDYTPVSLKESYVSTIPGAKLVVVPNTRHALPMERPEAFNAALAPFLDQHYGNGTAAARTA